MLANGKRISPPWHANRLISWWDMEKFSAVEFYNISRLLTILEHAVEHDVLDLAEKISQKECEFLIKRLQPEMADLCAAIDLRYSAEHIGYLCGRLESGLSFQQTRELLAALSREIMFEMRNQLFFHVPARDA